jgi:IPT/TIG domain
VLIYTSRAGRGRDRHPGHITTNPGQITIKGTAFGTLPPTVKIDGMVAHGIHSATMVVCYLPAGIAPGSYFLQLTNNSLNPPVTSTFDVTLGAVGPAGPTTLAAMRSRFRREIAGPRGVRLTGHQKRWPVPLLLRVGFHSARLCGYLLVQSGAGNSQNRLHDEWPIQRQPGRHRWRPGCPEVISRGSVRRRRTPPPAWPSPVPGTSPTR